MHALRTRRLTLWIACAIVTFSLAARECAPTHTQAATGGRDCNGNGIEDAIDIANGTSSDLDGDGVPDECRFGR
ncbi:MAG: hypothetical protein FJ298_04695 [Planctomycetes bacterium]|nr:hypothetical protein [Planctomycetota bacterium]